MPRMTKPANSRSATTAAAHVPLVPLSAAEKLLGVSVRTARERFCLLTPREAQVAELMAEGKPNRHIAEELGISVKTLDIHRAHVMHKLIARTTTDVANLVNLLQIAEAAL